MVVTAQTFEDFALEHPDEPWELHHGALHEKPAMSYGHSDVIFALVRQLHLQLDPAEFRVRANRGHVHHAAGNYYVADVYVVPFAEIRDVRHRPRLVEIYPYDRTLIAWRRQPDGTYAVAEYHGGAVPVSALPGVTIDLDALFE